MVCTFFGHRECWDLAPETLEAAIADLIAQGVDTFYVGYQGQFDRLVLSCLRKLAAIYPQISFSVVLANLNDAREEFQDCGIYPEGLEPVPPKFALDRRNHWMVEQADFCICYVNRTWGGAWKFSRLAKRLGRNVRNLGSGKL